MLYFLRERSFSPFSQSIPLNFFLSSFNFSPFLPSNFLLSKFFYFSLSHQNFSLSPNSFKSLDFLLSRTLIRNFIWFHTDQLLTFGSFISFLPWVLVVCFLIYKTNWDIRSKLETSNNFGGDRMNRLNEWMDEKFLLQYWQSYFQSLPSYPLFLFVVLFTVVGSIRRGQTYQKGSET